jgi:hypothetical protein
VDVREAVGRQREQVAAAWGEDLRGRQRFAGRRGEPEALLEGEGPDVEARKVAAAGDRAVGDAERRQQLEEPLVDAHQVRTRGHAAEREAGAVAVPVEQSCTGRSAPAARP